MTGKKIVFLDIDGTFTVPLEKPTELASRAVREARKKWAQDFDQHRAQYANCKRGCSGSRI